MHNERAKEKERRSRDGDVERVCLKQIVRSEDRMIGR